MRGCVIQSMVIWYDDRYPQHFIFFLIKKTQTICTYIHAYIYINIQQGGSHTTRVQKACWIDSRVITCAAVTSCSRIKDKGQKAAIIR
jgi:hypothetical protein